MTGDAARQRYVLGDWGTSRLRLFLLEDNAVASTCEGPGIGALAQATAEMRIETLAGLVSPWMDKTQPMQVLLAGMAGSRNGLFEVPYATLPADCIAWAGQARTTRTHGMRITIAGGVCSRGNRTGADIMRGEETQIFGALERDPALGRGTHVVLLPGTHSKWVEIEDGSITRFQSAMTGELYALLHDRSTLLKTDTAAANAGTGCDADRDEGFGAGVERSSNLDGGLLAALFETRAAQLLDNRSKSWAEGFLSGLLIGHEIASMSGSFRTAAAIRIIGDPQLVSLYRTVFSARGIGAQTLDGTECAIAGLRFLRNHVPEL